MVCWAKYTSYVHLTYTSHPFPGSGSTKLLIGGQQYGDLHSVGGLITMANTIVVYRLTQSSPSVPFFLQFFITCAKTEWLDNKHVVFGRVIEDGLLVVRKIEHVATGALDKPQLPVVVTECGEM